MFVFDENRSFRSEHQHVMVVGFLALFRRHEFCGDFLLLQMLERLFAIPISADPGDKCAWKSDTSGCDCSVCGIADTDHFCHVVKRYFIAKADAEFARTM